MPGLCQKNTSAVVCFLEPWFLFGIMGKVQEFDNVVPPSEAVLKFHEEVVPLSKTHGNSACLKG